jgi:hypothetical protein
MYIAARWRVIEKTIWDDPKNWYDIAEKHLAKLRKKEKKICYKSRNFASENVTNCVREFRKNTK